MAEDEGFEPPQTESESGVLPLHKSSIWNSSIICKISKKSIPNSAFLKKLFCLLQAVLHQHFRFQVIPVILFICPLHVK